MLKKNLIKPTISLILLGTALCTSAVASRENSKNPGPAVNTKTEGEIDSLNAILDHARAQNPRNSRKAPDGLINRIYAQGSLPVIVRLQDSDQPRRPFAGKTTPRGKAIKGLQDKVLDDVFSRTGRSKTKLRAKRFKMIPAMALQIDAPELEALLANPNVIDIIEDVPVPPTLQDSVSLIGGELDGAFSGYTGQGQTIAILDTGIDKNHPFLSGKVVSEACYSTNMSSLGASSLCPDNATESTATDSALSCDPAVTNYDHGTHVAGIAAGNSDTFSGVAKDASIIAIQVFSRFDNADYCGANPCVLSFVSDQVKGLERVYELRDTYAIASANMSLGEGAETSPCDSDSRKPIIDSLRTAGIATIISSGNGSVTNALGIPGCISSAVSVGSTTKINDVSSFSNSADFLSLLAPGSTINSSIPGTDYSSLSGTSMAAPHVAGAWAVIKQVSPDAGVTEVLAALQDTGVSITDTREGAENRVKPSIDVSAAVEFMAINEANANCDDYLYCTGTEMWIDSTCIAGTDPCPGMLCDEINDTCVECIINSDCPDDSLYCTGSPVCSDGECGFADDPCGAGELCDELTNQCEECINNNDCPDDSLYCTGSPVCMNGECGFADDPCGANELCDEVNSQCVECIINSDCPDDSLYCTGSPVCSDGECGFADDPCGAGELCDEVNSQCVECLGNEHCSTGYQCISDTCAPVGFMLPTKATVKADKTANADRIKFSGKLDVEIDDFNEVNEVIITLMAAYVPDPGAITFTFPVDEDCFKKGKYKSAKVKPAAKGEFVQSLSVNTRKGKIKFSAKNIDLTGLSCPIILTVQIGSYVAEVELDENIVNGKKKPCPLPRF